MRVFYVLAQSLDERARRQSAFVIADNPEEALLLVKKSEHFAGFALPPIELTDQGEDAAAVGDLIEALPSEKGVYPIAPVDAIG